MAMVKLEIGTRYIYINPDNSIVDDKPKEIRAIVDDTIVVYRINWDGFRYGLEGLKNLNELYDKGQVIILVDDNS